MSLCTRGDLDSPIDIPGLEWYAAEEARIAGFRSLPEGPVSGRAVAVLGAGPAGLSAAAELRRRGHRVVLYDACKEPGGALVWSIPPFRLPRDMVAAEIETILGTGVELRLDQVFESIESLHEAFDAVVVAVGLGLRLRLGVDGEDLGGVIPSVVLLDGSVDDVGPLPVVVGGGTAALDAAMTALRLAGTAGRVNLLYRRAAQHMPGNQLVIAAAEEEGIILRPMTVIERILGDPEGNVALVRCRSVDLGEADETGRPQPIDMTGGTFDMPASSVIVAAGEAADLELLEGLGLPDEAPRGDHTGRTNEKGVYVAGDVVGGPRSVVGAVASGLAVARAIDEDLERETEGPYPVLGPQVDLSVDFLGKTLPNPFMLSASPVTDDLEMAEAALEAGFGGLVLKTTTVEGTTVELKHPSIKPMADGPRMIVAMGNIDLISVHHLERVTERIQALKVRFPERFVAASIVATNREGWQELAKGFAEAEVDAIEVGVSCPQGTIGGQGAMIGQDPNLVRSVVRWVKEAAPEVPMMVKLTPLVSDIAAIAKAAASAGADGLCASNSVPALSGIDVDSCAPLPTVGGKSSYSGMSGPAILPLALRNVAEVARATDLAISGCGGVETWRDAISMMMVGARTVQLATAVMHHGLDLFDTLSSGLARYMERLEIEKVEDLVGRALASIATHDELKQPGAVRAKVDLSTCIGCGRCHIACRDGAHRAMGWASKERQPSVSLERCVGCGLCAGVCPSDSVSYMILGT
jgi:dihydropyrimidine dehydrogenase (NAD+) subunit PreA